MNFVLYIMNFFISDGRSRCIFKTKIQCKNTMEMPLHHKNYQPPTSLVLLFVLFKIIVTLVKDQVHNARNTILLRNDCNYEGKI